MKRVDYAGALIIDESRQTILMVNNISEGSSYWSLPCGEVKSQETLEQAVIRETKEETGLDIVVMNLFSVREVFFAKSEQHALLFTFYAKIIGGDIQIMDPDDEIQEVKWMDVQIANELMSYIPDHLKIQSGDANKAGMYYFHGMK